MNQGQYIFAQIIELISYKKFQTLVNRYKGDYKVKDFNCWKQFLCMAFGQLTHRESLSDTIVNSGDVHPSFLDVDPPAKQAIMVRA